MGMKLIYGLFFLLVFLSIGIGLLMYSIKKKSKTGLIISIIMILFVGLALLTNTIDEITITKKDIISDLSHINIELKNDFKITNNKVTGMPERIQETEIQISQKDKDRIINEITTSTKFKSFVNGQEQKSKTETKQFGTSDKIIISKYPEFYSLKTYTKIDNYPTRLFVSIYDKTNIINYQRIEY